MTRPRRAGIGMALVAAGCTTGAQTIEQDLAYQRVQQCSRWPTIVVQRINTDGRVVASAREHEQYPWLQCMAEQARAQQKSKPNLVVPDPIVNPIPR